MQNTFPLPQNQNIPDPNEMDNKQIINNNNNEHTISVEINLSILKIVCFANDLLYATFTDNTSIIVHPSFEYFTYFNCEGQKTDMKCEYLIKKDSIDSKMNLIVSVYNLFSENVCPYTKTYIDDYEFNCEIVRYPVKLNTIYWINSFKYFDDSNDEFYQFTSSDYTFKILLFRNLRIIKVEYLQEYKPERNQFMKICKFFSINNVCRFWVTPLILLMNYFHLNIPVSNPILLNWNIEKDLVIKNEYKTEVPYNINESKDKGNVMDKGELNMASEFLYNPMVFAYHKTLPVRFIYTKNYAYLVDIYDYEIDIINNMYPNSIIYTVNHCNMLFYNENTEENNTMNNFHIDTYEKIHVEMRKKNRLLNNEENEECEDDNDDYIGEIAEEIVNIKNYGNLQNLKYYINKNNQDNFNKSNLQNNQNFKNNNKFNLSLSQYKENQIVNMYNSQVNNFIFKGDEQLLYREIKGIGEFYSYTSKSVKGNFCDRTVVRMNGDCNKVEILNKYGEKFILFLQEINTRHEFYPYVKYLVDFFDFCFDNENIEKNTKANQEINEFIHDRIQKIEEANKYLFNKEKYFSDEYMFKNIPTQDDINNLIKRNENMLNDIKNLNPNNNNHKP